MESLTTLQVAGGVIQFVDFGSKLLSNSRKLYRSADGVLSENIDLEIITTDLANLLLSLERKLPDQRPISEVCSKSEDERAVDVLCIRCVEIARELIARLNKLKLVSKNEETKSTGDDDPILDGVQRSGDREGAGWSSMLKPNLRGKSKIFRKWSAFRKALEAIWKKEEIETMAATLREFRCEIELRILVMFRATLSQLVVQQSQFSRQLTESTRAILDSFIHTRDNLASQLRCQVEKLVFAQISKKDVSIRLPEHIDANRQGELKLAGSFQYPKGMKADEGEIDELPARAYEVEESLRLLMIENSVLGSLCFDSIHDRRDSVEPPFKDTFEWIFEEPGSAQRPWSNFIAWLRQDSGIYWINGKAASGKSTLMRYLHDHERTKVALKEWAGSVPLETSHFFFWKIGDEYQNSQKGLLRSLLHDILQQHRDLIPVVMPEVWETWSSRADAVISNRSSLHNSVLRPEPKSWGMSQLKLFFQTLLRALQSKVKLCMFIDGLDEYDGDHYEIAEMFEEFAEFSNVKLCLSSRPLLSFEQAFEGQPSLKLQDLTAKDISYYVKENLYRHKYMMILSKENPVQVTHLVDDVVEKARGVFLWVKLVVRSLLRGLSDYNRISDLQRRVEYLPGDLEALYSHMLQNTDPFYHAQASKIFQIVRAAQHQCPSRLTLLNLSWADDEDELLAENASIEPLSYSSIATRCKAMDARLKSVCAGLLESIDTRFSDIAPDSKVLFLHRTVSDWMAQPKVWSEITSQSKEEVFSPNLAMLKSSILQIKCANITSSLPLDMGIITNALQFAVEAEKDINNGFPRLLDQLDIAASYHWRVGKAKFTNELELSSSLDSETSSIHDVMGDEMGLFDFEDQSSDLYLRPPQTSISLTTGVQKLLSESSEKTIQREPIVEHDFARHHWSIGVNIPTIGFSGRPKTFYDLAVAIGLSHYTRMKFESGNIVDQDVEQHMLLHSITSSSNPDPDILRRILINGTDPNLSYDGFSPWEQVLLCAAAHFNQTPCGHLRCRDHPPDIKWKQAARNWAEIIKVFLDHGAMPDLVTQNHHTLKGHPRLSPRIIIEDYFPAFLVKEKTNLKLLLRQKGVCFDLYDETRDPGNQLIESHKTENHSITKGNEEANYKNNDSKDELPERSRYTWTVQWMLSWVMGH